jgi:hypothetical protein
LQETAKKLELLNSLIQRAATLQGRNDPRLIPELGAACAAMGHDAEARAWYHLAIARDPLDAVSQKALFRLAARDKQGSPAGPTPGSEPSRE